MVACSVGNKSGHDLFDCDHMACEFMSYPVRRLIIQSVLMCECEMSGWMNSACDSQAIYLALSLHQSTNLVRLCQMVKNRKQFPRTRHLSCVSSSLDTLEMLGKKKQK